MDSIPKDSTAGRQDVRTLCVVCHQSLLWKPTSTHGGGWVHEPSRERYFWRGAAHEPEAELRLAIDATCPGCDFPEIGYATGRREFICSRCGFTSTERPVDRQWED